MSCSEEKAKIKRKLSAKSKAKGLTDDKFRDG
jgi:hypothetical protein